MRRLSRVTLACIALLAFSAAAAQAQTIGFKIGASLSRLDIDDSEDDRINTLTSFAGGGFVRFELGRLGIQPELLAITKGASIETSEGDGDIKLDYIEIPVLLHLPLTYGASFAPYVFGGPTIAFETGCHLEAEDDDEIECDDADFFERKSTDLGIAAGAGLAFAMGPGALLFEGRYTWGMTDINDTGTGNAVKNRSALIVAGYSIPLGRR